MISASPDPRSFALPAPYLCHASQRTWGQIPATWGGPVGWSLPSQSHRANWWVRPGTAGTPARGPPHGSARPLSPRVGHRAAWPPASCSHQLADAGGRWWTGAGVSSGGRGVGWWKRGCPCPRRRLASWPGVGTRAPEARPSPAPLQAPGAAGALDGEVLTNKSSQGRADAQRLVATRLLDRVHDPLGHFSRLQRIYPRAR